MHPEAAILIEKITANIASYETIVFPRIERLACGLKAVSGLSLQEDTMARAKVSTQRMKNIFAKMRTLLDVDDLGKVSLDEMLSINADLEDERKHLHEMIDGMTTSLEDALKPALNNVNDVRLQ